MIMLEGNTIYLYGVIGDDMFDYASSDIQFRTALRELKGKPVNVRINSPGGDAYVGFNMFKALREHDGEVTTINDGLAASAASLVFVAGVKRIMTRPSMIMVHEPATIVYGNAAEMQRAADFLTKMNDEIVETYAAATGNSTEQIATMLAAETWMTSEEAIDLGFATTAEFVEAGSIEVQNSIVPEGRFRNTPQNYLKPKAELQRIKRRDLSPEFTARLAKLHKRTGIAVR